MKTLPNSLAMLSLLFSPNRASTPPPSSAAKRAETRLLKQRAKQEVSLPDEIGTYTRQQARADARAFDKEMRHLRKVDAMQKNQPGGAAAIR